MDKIKWFDEMAAKWDSMFGKEKINLLVEILKELNIRENSVVLDVGTGTGVLVPWIRKAVGPGGKIVAFDYAREMVTRAREKHDSKAVFLVADVHVLELESETFDEVVCNSAFPHFDNKLKAMQEMVRVLKNGGRLSIFHPGTRKEINHFHSNLSAPVSRDYLPADEEIAAMAQATGLKDISIKDGPRYYLMTAVKR